MLDEKYISFRLGDTLDEILMKNEEYLKCRDDLSKKTNKLLVHPQNDEQCELYNDYENVLAEFEGVSMRQSYALGYEDGLKVGRESSSCGHTVLSFDDMIRMIHVYEAVKTIAELSTGSSDLYWEGEPKKRGIYDSVFDVIYNGAGAGFRLAGQQDPDKMYDVLEDKSLSIEAKAEILTQLH